MSNKPELMSYALFGHLTALTNLVDKYHVENLYGDKGIASQDASLAKLYAELASTIDRNKALWSFEYPSFNDGVVGGISRQEWESKFVGLLSGCLTKTTRLSVFLFDFMSSLPMKCSLRELMIRSMLRTHEHDDNRELLEKNMAFTVGEKLVGAHSKSMKKNYLDIYDDPFVTPKNKVIDADNLLRILVNILERHTLINPAFMDEFTENQRTHHDNAEDRLSLFPTPLLRSPHTKSETVNRLTNIFDNLSHYGTEIDLLSSYILPGRLWGRIRITDSDNQVAIGSFVSNTEGRSMHPDVPEEGGQSFFARRMIEKKFIINNYLLNIIGSPGFNQDRLTEEQLRTISRPNYNKVYTACRTLMFILDDLGNPKVDQGSLIKPSLVTDVLTELHDAGVDLYDESNPYGTIMQVVAKGLTKYPDTVAQIEHTVFQAIRSTQPEIQDTDPETQKGHTSFII